MPGAPPFEAELSRRTLVRGGGALIVGLALASRLAGEASAAPSPFASNGPAEPMQSDSYLAVLSDNTVHVKTGRVEIGQGSTTGLLLLVAEELDLNVDQLVFVRQDTNVTPDTGGTFGSSSIAQAGQRVRAACAAARQALLALASQQLGVPVASLARDRRRRLWCGPFGHLRRAGRRTAARGAAAGADPRSRPGAGQADLGVPPCRDLTDAAARHSGKGDGHLHLHPQRARARDAARPAHPPARAGGLRGRDAHPDPVDRRELDRRLR